MHTITKLFIIIINLKIQGHLASNPEKRTPAHHHNINYIQKYKRRKVNLIFFYFDYEPINNGELIEIGKNQ